MSWRIGVAVFLLLLLLLVAAIGGTSSYVAGHDPSTQDTIRPASRYVIQYETPAPAAAPHTVIPPLWHKKGLILPPHLQTSPTLSVPIWNTGVSFEWVAFQTPWDLRIPWTVDKTIHTAWITELRQIVLCWGSEIWWEAHPARMWISCIPKDVVTDTWCYIGLPWHPEQDHRIQYAQPRTWTTQDKIPLYLHATHET